MDINWYPGHMAKTKRELKELLMRVDIIIELIDARIPYSSKNPDIASLAPYKPRIIVLNKSDLADNTANKQWRVFFEGNDTPCVLANSVKGSGLAEVAKKAEVLLSAKKERQISRGRVGASVRAMILGIPNVGKSTFINQTAGRTYQKTEDRPGVTRQKQWIKTGGIMLLDTPGILWPNLGDPNVGIRLAITGAIKDNILDIRSLSLKLIELVTEIKPQALSARYKITIDKEDSPEHIFEKIARARGFLQKGGVINPERTSSVLTDEFRAGKIGRITLELPGG